MRNTSHSPRPRFPRRPLVWPRIAMLALLTAPAGACGGEDGPPPGSGDPAWRDALGYAGVFRLAGTDAGEDRRLGYSNGIIALDGQGNLWVASHVYSDQFAPFPIPGALGDSLVIAPVVDQGAEWTDLTQGVQTGIEGDREILGLLRLDQGWLYTVHEYYNGDGSHDPVLGYEGSGLWPTTHHSQATAGYLAEIHPDWRSALGGDLIAGLAGTTIHQEASHGPVAHVFSLSPSSLPGASDTVATSRVLFYPLGEAHEDFTDVSSIRGAAFTADALYLFGQRGLGAHWYGLPDEGPGGADPCSGSKGYHAEARTSWVWVVAAADLADVAAGGDPRVPTVYSGSMDEVLGLTGLCTAILGAAYDRGAERLYLATDDQAHEGMEPQPAIHVLDVPPP